MAKLILILASYLLAFITTTKANDSTLQLQIVNKIWGDYKNFEIDNLGNIYLISATNQIKKININLDSVGVFNDSRRFGNITNIDVKNPLKILVFYKDFSTITILDRFFNIINTIDLRKQNLLQASCIATSYDNNIWLFDEVESKLKKIDDAGNVLLETADFRLLFNNDFVPQTIIDADGKLYLYHQQKGLVTFDYYGAIKNKYALVGLHNVQLADGKFVGFNKQELHRYDFAKLTSSVVKLNNIDTALAKIILHQNLYTLTKNNLIVYGFK